MHVGPDNFPVCTSFHRAEFARNSSVSQTFSIRLLSPHLIIFGNQPCVLRTRNSPGEIEDVETRIAKAPGLGLLPIQAPHMLQCSRRTSLSLKSRVGSKSHRCLNSSPIAGKLTFKMLGSCLRALARSRLAAAGKEAQLQQLRFLNLHEYQVGDLSSNNWRRGASMLADPQALTCVYKHHVPVLRMSKCAIAL